MITPLGWLERVPTYKDQQEKLADRDLSTYGFLGYPLMQGADILIYRANMVPVGEDQVPHVELMREIARRFNHIYGREPGFEEKAQAAVKKLGARRRSSTASCAPRSRSRATPTALDAGEGAARRDAEPLARRPRAAVRLPRGRRADDPRRARGAAHRGVRGCPGLDGQKMSKSYGNTIVLREERRGDHEEDPHHADRSGARSGSDPGDPEKCPVWQLHQIYSDAKTQGLGRSRAARARASAAWNASSR